MKSVRRLLATLASLVLGAAMLCPTAFATVQTEAVDIDGVTQSKSKWCWAACAEITGKAVYPSSSRDQYDVVKYLKGTSSTPYPNSSGSIQDSATGSEYAAYNTKDFTSKASKWNFSQIATSLSRGNPVQAGAGYYSGSTRNGGHVVVVCMTQFIDDSSGIEYYIDYYDPWDGTSHHCTLDAFSDGSYNGRKYDQTIYVVE